MRHSELLFRQLAAAELVVARAEVSFLCGQLGTGALFLSGQRYVVACGHDEMPTCEEGTFSEVGVCKTEVPLFARRRGPTDAMGKTFKI